MAAQIVRPPSPARPGVLVHRLECATDAVLTLMSSTIALSPGTMTVDVAPDSSSISVHFFHLTDIDGARRSIAHLERLAVAAVGPPLEGTTRPTAEEGA